MYNQGDIIIVSFPFSDSSLSKQRPALILSKDTNLNEILICGITSVKKDHKNSIKITNKDMSSGSIIKDSYIRIDKIYTIKKDLIKKKVAKVNDKILSNVKNKFRDLV